MNEDKYRKLHETLIRKRGSFADHFPDLVSEWHPTLNNGSSPSDYTPKCGQKVWWKCRSCGNEWEASLAHRADGRGCPKCSKRSTKEKLIAYYAQQGPLSELRPDLANEWHPRKNGNLTPEKVSSVSGQKVWWLCPKCGYEWQSLVSNRVNGNGCPKCAHAYQTSEPEQALVFYLSQFFDDIINPWKPPYFRKASIDIYIPSLNLAIEYDGGVWHKDTERDLKKSKLLEENGVKLVRIREKHAPIIQDNSYQIESLKTTANLSVLDTPIENLFAYINSTFTLSLIPDIDIQRDYNAIVESMANRKRERSFIVSNPSLLEEWDYDKNNILPEYLAAGSNQKVWWICDKGHSWSAVVSSRTNGTGCPFCAGRKAITGVNDIATLAPELLEIWNYEKNTITPENTTYRSNKKVWWKCKVCGFEWHKSPNQQGKLGCLKCNSKRRLIPGLNDFATIHPELLSEWDYSKNTISPSEISKSSNKTVWWKCSKGHEWESSVHSRVVAKGCPFCSGKRVIPGETDLATKRPSLAKLWDASKNNGDTPSSVFPNGTIKRWWKCPECGYEWYKSPNSISIARCPKCKRVY